MQNPPPPSQQQAEEAQRARFSAEAAIRSLIAARSTSTSSGEGSGDQSSSLHAVKIGMILAALSRSIKRSSFRHTTDRGESLLLSDIPDDEVAGRVLTEAQRAFERLAASELPDDQAAVLWATWAHSRTADEIARIINGGGVDHEFSGTGRVLKKVWISRSDRRVRKLHADLHGKTVGTDRDFWRWPDTDQRLRWPGDVEAPLEATAGCRCVCLLTWADQDSVSETIRRIVEETDPSS